MHPKLSTLQNRLEVLLDRYDAGECSVLYPEVRVLTDEVISLLDEAPDPTKSAIDRLARRCEALLRSLAN